MRKTSTWSKLGEEIDPRHDPLLDSISLEVAIERDIGERGTPAREEFEAQLKVELLGAEIKKIRNQKILKVCFHTHGNYFILPMIILIPLQKKVFI